MKYSLLSIGIVSLALVACTTAPTTNDNGSSSSSASVTSSDSSAPATAQVDSGCKLGGCSAEICVSESSEDIASNCIWKPEFACYQQFGHCMKQADDSCAWEESTQLNQCLEGSVGSEDPAVM